MTQTASSTDPKVLVQRLLAPIADDMKAVDDYIRAELASDVSRMHEISEYITSAGGKRMRPALLILISRALGYKGDICCYLGATIELLHTATLMHAIFAEAALLPMPDGATAQPFLSATSSIPAPSK